MKHAAPRFTLLAVAAGLCMVGAGCSTLQPATGVDLSEVDQEAQLTVSNEQFAEALAHFGLGVVHELHRERTDAIAQYLKAIELDPENEELYMMTARRLTQEKRNEESLEVIRKLMLRRPDSPRPYLWMASIHQQAKNYEQAERNYRKAILVDPTRTDIYTRLCLMLYEQEEYAKATTLLEQSLAKVGQRIKIYDFLGNLYRKQAESEIHANRSKALRREGITMYRKAIDEFPGHRSFYFHLGALLARDGNIIESLDNFQSLESFEPDDLATKKRISDTLSVNLGGNEAAINKLSSFSSQAPSNAFVHYYLGQLHEAENQVEPALKHYRTAAKLDPLESSAYFKFAQLNMTNDVQAAEALLREGLEKMPDDARIMETLAYLLMHRQAFEESLDLFDRVQRSLNRDGIVTNTGNFHYNYAVAAQQSGKLEMASYQLYRAAKDDVSYLSKFLQQLLQQETNEHVLKDGIQVLGSIAKRMPREPAVQIYLGLLHNYETQYADAVRHFQRVVKLSEDSGTGSEYLNAQFFFTYAAATERTGDVKEAERLFRICLNKNADHAEAYNYLAYMWAEKGIKLDEADELIDKAIKLVPDNGAFLDTKGWIRYMQGDFQGALKLLHRAAEIIDDDPTINDHVGDALSKLGRLKEAKAQWKKVLVMDDADEDMIKSVNEKLNAVELEMKRIAETKRKAAEKKRREAARKKREAEEKKRAEDAAPTPATAPEAPAKPAEPAPAQP